MKPLSYYVVLYLRAHKLELEHPVLVWRSAPSEKPAPVWKTRAPVLRPRPTDGEPVVFELEKGTHSGNAFAMGVTLGRTDSNDVVIDDDSVSRFHAYFQHDAKDKKGALMWTIADADSRNGSTLNGSKLQPRQPHPLREGDHLRLGDVDLEFHEPAGFESVLVASTKKPDAAKD